MVARLLPGVWPGLGLAAAGGGVALLVHAAVPVLSPTLVAVALGIGVATLGAPAAATAPGMRVASRQVLRVGVALLGLQVVLPEILALGWPVLATVVAVVVLGIAGTLALARPLGVPPERALLVACGFSICGAAAVAAVEGVRRSRDEDSDDLATVVSLVVVFGSVAMLALPLTAAALGLAPAAAGAWSGASVHEVGQVVVAGGLLGGAALQVAVAVKLGRVLMLAPVLAVLSWHERRTAVRRPPLVPGFVLAFVALAAVGGAVPAPVLDAAAVVQSAALATAMFALGRGLDAAVLRRTGRPVVLLAAAATVLVALLGLPAALLA